MPRTFAGLAIDQLMMPAPGKDHDRILVTSRFVGVADGATPLAEAWPSDVGAFAAHALIALAAASAKANDIRSVWRTAIAATSAQFSVVEPELSCGVAMARLIGDRIEVATIGDCGAVVSLRDGAVLSVRDERLAALDAARGTGNDTEVRARRLADRSAMNTPDGYWIFAGRPEASDHVRIDIVPAGEVVALLLYTDGFYRLREPYRVVHTDAELLALTRRLGTARAASQLHAYEHAHPADPRVRRPDDVTVLLAHELERHDLASDSVGLHIT